MDSPRSGGGGDRLTVRDHAGSFFLHRAITARRVDAPAATGLEAAIVTHTVPFCTSAVVARFTPKRAADAPLLQTGYAAVARFV